MSCARMTIAKIPATEKKKNESQMYMTPISL